LGSVFGWLNFPFLGCAVMLFERHVMGKKEGRREGSWRIRA
jgi:hypothetical protein